MSNKPIVSDEQGAQLLNDLSRFTKGESIRLINSYEAEYLVKMITTLTSRLSETEARLKELEWISVEDRLPENNDSWQNDRILFTSVTGVVREGCYDLEDGFFHEGSSEAKYIDIRSHRRTGNLSDGQLITHWMPIECLSKLLTRTAKNTEQG